MPFYKERTAEGLKIVYLLLSAISKFLYFYLLMLRQYVAEQEPVKGFGMLVQRTMSSIGEAKESFMWCLYFFEILPCQHIGSLVIVGPLKNVYRNLKFWRLLKKVYLHDLRP